MKFVAAGLLVTSEGRGDVGDRASFQAMPVHKGPSDGSGIVCLKAAARNRPHRVTTTGTRTPPKLDVLNLAT